jgi:hypothetical protein
MPRGSEGRITVADTKEFDLDDAPDELRCGGCGELHCRCDDGYDPTPDPEVTE